MFTRMTVNMNGTFLRTVYTDEIIYYVDSSRYIFVYGLDIESPVSLRVVWLTTDDDDETTVFNSYDVIGGFPGEYLRSDLTALEPMHVTSRIVLDPFS